MKVYGPYFNHEGRQHVIIIYEDGSRKTKPYPRYIVEKYINRELERHLEIDHIDGNFLNNELSNLRIVDKKQHLNDDSIRVEKIEITCLWCGIKALKDAKDLKHNQKAGKDGPFCGRSCGAKYGREKQLGRLESWGNDYVDNREYYTLKEAMDIKSNLDDYRLN